MGNAPSVAELPPEWDDILANTTREDILRSSRLRCRIAEGEDKSSVYLDDDLFDLDEHVPMALAILTAHPHLKGIRFKLVPSRMTEERYWAALFGIVNDGGLADIDNVVGKIDDDYETGDEIDDNADVMEGGGDNDNSMMPPPTEAQSPPENNNEKNKLGRTPIAKLERAYFDDNGANESKADATNTPPFYLEEIKSQQAHIAQLQKSLREANHKTRKLALELHKERKKRHDEGVVDKEDSEMKTNNSHSDPVKSCPRCNSSLTKQQTHKGKWEIHPDCNEFMKLDDHLKDNLRKEKEKRLDEVRSQMKFILDTDDIKDSYGKWSCCGKEEYEADGCT